MARSSRQTRHAHIAAAVLAGPWTKAGILDRHARVTGDSRRWRHALVRQLFTDFGAAAPTDAEELRSWLDRLPPSALAAIQWSAEGREWFWTVPVMAPQGESARGWGVPALPTTAALAEWLELLPGHVEWLADCQRRTVGVADERLRHYRRRWVRKRAGRWRLLEIPKARLKQAQMRILRGILDRIPPHEAAHAYRVGRSVATYVRPHAGKPVVLRFDLRDFFPSVPAARVHALFRTAGYPLTVARLLTGLCTTCVSEDAFGSVRSEEFEARTATWQRYRSPHLPQGAPTSPALANLCAYRFDTRLAGVATTIGAAYTRYADDLAFSGGDQLARSARRFQVFVGRVALEEGFELYYRKSRFMRRGLRQQLAGVVVNEHPNVPRPAYDRLKAILTNCARHGPASQNRDGHAGFRGHLLGRIGYVAMLNPARGERLRRLYDAIRWD
jgi:hypothetical protein